MPVQHIEYGHPYHLSRRNRRHVENFYSHSTSDDNRQAVDPNSTVMFHGRATDVEDMPLGIRLHGAPELHNDGFTGKGIRVGVIDSGVDKDHPLFQGAVVLQRWYKDGGALHDNPHGTHVAGTVNMMAPDAEIVDYRVFGEKCVKGGELGLNGYQTTNESIAMAIDQAVKDGCHIINMSLGTPSVDIPIKDACENASKKGIILVVAAGNEGDDNPMSVERSYPAPFECCMSITSLAKKDGLPCAFFSNTNPENDYAGMGWDITSYAADSNSTGPDGYQRLSGTSMASPHVAGLIAALIDQEGQYASCLDEGDPANNDARVREMLTEYTIDVGPPGFDPGTGNGFVTYLKLPMFNEHFAIMGYRLDDLSHMDEPKQRPRRSADDLDAYQRTQRQRRRKYTTPGSSYSSPHRNHGYHYDSDDDRHNSPPDYRYNRYKYVNRRTTHPRRGQVHFV